MNPHLDELIELCRHPAIQERRGEWQEGDRFCIDGEIYTIGDYTIAGDGMMAGDVGVYYYWDDMIRAIWVPPLSDPLRPERSLIGMINRFYDLHYSWRTGKFTCNHWHSGDGGDDCFLSYYGPTPEIAVAKAVIAQEE